LERKNYFLAAITVGLLGVTSGISLLLLPFYYGVLWYSRKRKDLSLQKILLYVGISALPFFLWGLFCYIHTGNPFIFVETRDAWYRPPFFPFFYNIELIFRYPWLPTIALYGSKLDVMCIVVTLCVTYLSKSVLPKVVWLATIVLAFSPLLVQDSISFARFITVLFPFFVYLAVALKKNYYIMLVCLFTVGLLFSSLYFINWYWIE
jgi:hypothetical protein